MHRPARVHAGDLDTRTRTGLDIALRGVAFWAATLLVELAVLVPFMTAPVAVPAVVAGSVTFGLWRRVPAGD